MSILERATRAIIDAEATMKGLIGEAAASGDYSLVETLVQWASKLGTMSLEASEAANQVESAVSTKSEVQPASDVALERKRPSTKSSASKRRSYPVFAKSGDDLVKFAWSKSSKSEYQHKSPQFAVRKLAESLIRRAKNGSIVSMDKILPLKADDGSDIPDYQAYVSLAWLRQVGVVKQNGRQGYTIKKGKDCFQQIDAAWNRLPDANSG